MAKQLNVDVNLNTAKAEALLKNLLLLLTQAITTSSKTSGGGLTNEIVLATKAAADLKVMLNLAMNPSTGNLDLSRFSLQLAKSKTTLNDYAKSLTKLGPQGLQAFMSLSKSIVSAEVPMRETGKLLNELGTTFKNTLRWQATSSVIHNLVGGILNALSYARGLDSSLNSIRIVTGQSAELMNKFARAANESAKALSASTLDYTDAALIYYQLGIRDEKEIKARTDATIKMANVTKTSAQLVSEQLTAIWNNFADGSTNLEYYADVITALGAATASSSAEISKGLEKFAAVADTVGLSYEYATSALATIVATTRQSEDIVGTALKTLFARIQDLELGETLDDGTTLGKYSKALDAVGISIKDLNGLLRDMDNILDDMGSKWKTLNKDQLVALALTVAGQRQYTQLVALMDNWDFMQENLKVAYGAEGELQKQADIYAESWDAARTRVKAAAQGIYDDLISDKFFIGMNDMFAGLLGGIDKFVDALGGIPGTLGLIGSVVMKVFSLQIGQSLERSIQSFKVFTGVAKVEANSVRQLAITAAETFTPGTDAPKSMQMQSSALLQLLVLANLYLMKMEAIAKAGGQVAASDKLRIASLMEIVELTLEAAIALQLQLEASREALGQASANIARNIMTEQMKKGVSRYLALQIANATLVSLGVNRDKLREAYFAQDALSRWEQNNYNLTSSLQKGLENALKQLIKITNEQRVRAKRMGNLGEAGVYLNSLTQDAATLRLLRSGEYRKLQDQYKIALKKASSYKGGKPEEQAKLDAEVSKLENSLKNISLKIKAALKNLSSSIAETEGMILEDLLNESEGTRNKFLDAIKEEVQQTVQRDDMNDLAESFIEETSEAIESLNKESFSGLTTGLTTAMSGVSNLAMGISSLLSGIRALNDESLSFGDKLLQVGMSFGMAVPMITSGLGSMVTGLKGLKTHGAGLLSSAFLANTAVGFGESNAYRAALLAGTGDAFLMGEGSKGRLGKAISGKRELRYFDKILKLQFKAGATRQEAIGAASLAYKNKYGKYIGSETAAARATAVLSTGVAGAQGAAVGGLSMLQVAGIVAALAALAVLIAKVKKELYDASLEGQLEKAAAEGLQLTSALEEAKTAAEGLKSAFDSYHNIADTLHNCTTGTKEWTEALRENNNEVLSLMSQYPELAKILGAILKNADGSLSISKEAEQEMNTIALNRIDTLSWAKLANTETQQMLKDLLDILAKGREMALLMESGKDIGYWSKGEYIKDTKLSAFDTDLFGAFYKTGAEGGVSDLHPYEQTHETSVGANLLANEALIKNWGDLLALSGELLTSALSDVFTKNNLGVSSDDLAKYSAAIESSTYRDELTKLYNLLKAAQDAFETSLIGVMSNRLASEGILENDTKTRDLISNIFGKLLDERTKAAVEEDKQKYASSKSERQRLAEEYVAAMGGDINSISFNHSGELSYLDSAGQKIEGITSSMVASVTGAASALEELAGSAEAAATAMAAIPRTEAGDAVRDFLINGDLTKTSTKGLREIFGNQLGKSVVTPDTLIRSLIGSAGGYLNVEAIASALGKDTNEFLSDLSKSALEANLWYSSKERLSAIAHLSSVTDLNRLENYSRAELEARQRYEDSKVNRGAVKTLEELETAALAAGEAHEYLNRAWKDGTRLSSEQLAGLKNIIADSEQYALVIDESTGKVKDASLLNDMLSKSVKDVGVEAARAQVPIYEQMNNLYSELANLDYSDIDYSKERQAGILQEIELLEQEITKYQELALALSGAALAYAKIAEGAEWDAARDYTDELEGAVKSIYSHMEDNNWKTLEWGSHEVLAAMEALLPENVLHPDENTPSWMTPQQYIEFIYGNGKKSGRYMSNGEVTYENAQNFIKDAIGGSGLGTGFANSINLETGEIDFKEALGEPEMYDTVSLADAARSMHMTEAAFLSMVTAMDKYNQSGTTFLSLFALEGSEFATLMQALALNVEDAAKQMQEALESGDPEKIKSASEELTKLLQALAKFRQLAIDDALKYLSLIEQRDQLLEDPTIAADDERLQSLNTQIAALEADGIELKVELVTDETSIENIKSKVLSAFERNKFNVDALNVDDWTLIISLIENLDNPFEGWEKSGLNKILTDTEKLPKNLQDALGKLGKDSSWVKDLNNGVKEALLGDGENQVGFEIDQESIDAMSKAIDEVCEKERTINAKLPDEVTDYLDNSDSSGKSGKYGGSHNPAHEGSTTSKSKPKVELPTSTPASKVNVDTGEAEAKLTILKTLIALIPPNIPLTVTTNSAVVSAELTTISSLAASISGIAPLLTISTNSNIIDAKLNRTKTFALALNRVKPRITILTNAGSIMNIVSRLLSALNNLKSPPPINIDVNIRVNGSMPKGTSPAFGTAQAFGTAAANGKWGTGKGPIAALVGELGPELVVDPSNGKFYTVGDTGAEFTMLPKNAIVFNHRLTELLLKYRKINSRGLALVEGNAFAAGVAAATGTAAAAGAGADLTYEQELLSILRKEADAYLTLETAVKKLNQTYEFIARNNDRLYGRDLIVNIEKSIQALEKLYQKLKKIEDMRVKDYENSLARLASTDEVLWIELIAAAGSTADSPKYNRVRKTSNGAVNLVQQLIDEGYLTSNPFTRDANGKIIDADLTAIEEANERKRIAIEDKYNTDIANAASEAAQIELQNAKARELAYIDTLKDLVGETVDSVDKMNQAINNTQDSLEEMHDLTVEKILKRLEMQLALTEGELKLIDSRMKAMGDSIYTMAESMAMIWNGDALNSSDKFSQIMEDLLSYKTSYQDAVHGLALAEENYLDAHAIKQEDFIKITEAARDGILDKVNELIDLRDLFTSYYGDVLSKADEELEKYTKKMDHLVSILEHLKNLMDLTGRKYDYKNQETIIRGLLEMAKDAYEVAKHWEITTKENMEAAQKTYEDLLLTDALGAENWKNNVLDKAIDYFNEAEEKMLSSAEDYLLNYENLWLNTLDAVRDKWDKLATDGIGWDALLDSMDRAKSIQEEYLTTTNKLYETNTLLRKVNKDINSTDSMISKEKLNDFAKMVEARLKDNQLTQSGMEILKAKYELLQAELALEEIKDAKDTVRLQRDSEGNYGYVYTADQEKIEAAEQNFADKLNDLYNLVLGYSNDYREKYILSLKEYEDKVMAIYENDALTEEERQRQLNELKQQYGDLWHAYDLTLQEAGLELNRVAAEGISEAWATLYDDRIAKLSEFLDASNEAEATLLSIMKEITDAHEDMTDEAELGLKDVEKKTKDVTTANHLLAEELNTEVMPKIDLTINFVHNLTAEFEANATAVANAIKEYQLWAQIMQNDIREKSGFLTNTEGDISDKIWQEYVNSGYTSFSKNLLAERSNTASSMTKEGGYYWNNGEMTTFMEAYHKNPGGYNSWSDLAYDVIYNNHVNEGAGGSLHSTLESWAKDTRRKKYNVEELASGGYTGEWGAEGKLAMLHEKELVLNATDTANMLDTIEALREMTRSMNLRSMISGMVDMIASPAFLNSLNNTLQQEVHITAEFPNATNHNEIEQAFTNLVNRASQYANRSNWKNSTDTLVESSVFD